MLVGESEPASTSGTVGSSPKLSPPPPSSHEASPTSPQQTAAAEVARAETQYHQASSWLAELKKARAQVAASTPSPAEKDLAGITSRAISLGNLSAEITEAQAKLGADRHSLTTAEANLAAARGAATTAQRYAPAPPPPTVVTPATRALAALVAAANKERDAATHSLAQDRAALRATNSALSQGIPNGVNIPANYAIARVRGLEQARAEQAGQVSNDQLRLDAANATLAAATTVTYDQQVNADQAAVAESRATVVRTGALGSDGKLKDLAQLSPAQTGAYYRFADASAKLQVDSAVRTQSARQLVVYASELSQYGTIAADAVGRVNHALAPVGMRLSTPVAAKPEKAQAALAQANNTLVGAVATWGVTSATVRCVDAGNRLAALAKLGPGTADAQLPGAQVAFVEAGANLAQASTYAQKLTAGKTAQADQHSVAAALAKYQAAPSASTTRRLKTARTQAAQSHWQLAMANANFLAASGQVYAARQSAPMLATQLRVADLRQQVNEQQQWQSACLSPTSPLQRELGRDEAALTQATHAAAPAQLTAQYLNANASLVAADYAHATAQGSATQDSASIQGALAQYQVNLARFRQSLPSNLLNPQSAADQAAYNAQLNGFFATQKGTLSDPAVASQLAGLAPGQKVNVQSGISEIRADLTAEQKITADRSLMQQGWDWITGQSSQPSGTAGYLNGELSALQALQRNENGMNAAVFNDRYLQIMGNLGARFGTMSEADIADEQNWSNAEQAVIDTASMVAAIAGAAVTGGALGVLVVATAGMIVDQGAEFAQNGDTVAEGGNLSSDPGISLFTPLTNNFGQGGVTDAERTQAVVGAETNAILSLTAAAGVGAGALVRGAATAALEPTLGGGTAARLISGMAGMTTTQGVMGLGQVGAAVPQGSEAVKQALAGAGINLLTSPLLGLGDGLGETALEGLASRTTTGAAAARASMNLGINLGLTASANAADGQGLNSAQWSSAIVSSLAPEAMDHFAGSADSAETDPGVTRAASPAREPGAATADRGTAFHPARPPFSPELEAAPAEAATRFDPQSPTPPVPESVRAAHRRYYEAVAIEAAGGPDPEHTQSLFSSRRSLPDWTPNSTDHTLIVGGIGKRNDGEVSLNVDRRSQPNILSDIRHTPIPDEHFGSIVFESFDYDVLHETPPLALREAYRILKPGGSLRVTTSRDAIVGADERATTIHDLTELGFADVEVNWLPYARDPYTGEPTQFFEFRANKPSADDVTRPLLPSEISGATVTNPATLSGYPAQSVRAVFGDANASLLLDSPSQGQSDLVDQLRHMLKPGGTVALNTGGAVFEQREAMQRRLEQAGFVDVSIRFVGATGHKIGPAGNEIAFENPEAGWTSITAQVPSSSTIVSSLAPEAMDHIAGKTDADETDPGVTRAGGPFREPSVPTADLGAAYRPERPGLSPEMEVALAEAAAGFDPQRPTPPDPESVRAAQQRYHEDTAIEVAGGPERSQPLFSPRRSSPDWTPNSADHTLIVGGIGKRNDGEVSLNAYPSERPNILSDIRQTPIPDEHFSSIVCEGFPYTILDETPPTALREIYRILKPGGSLRITTGKGALEGALQDRIIHHLIELGFADVGAKLLPYEPAPYTGKLTPFFEFRASKPSADDITRPLRPSEISGATVTNPATLSGYPAQSVRSVSGDVNGTLLLGSPSQDQSDLVDQLRHVLKPGGTVALDTGGMVFEQREVMQRRLEQAGFLDVSIRFVGRTGHEIAFENPEAGWTSITAHAPSQP